MGGKFQPATRRKARLRMALDGPAGSGKSYTALRFAFALGKRVAVIDTENGSASLYQGDAPDGTPWQFDVLELSSFSPTEYTSAIEEAGRQKYDVLVIDSLSHAWAGKEGALELKDRHAGVGGDNSFTAWRHITPMHNRMVEAILASPCHVIATMRSKTEYVLQENDRGKMEPRRVGMAPIQRAGMEYEFTLYGSLDWSHIMTVTKSRCSAVENAVVVRPDAGWMRPVIDWLERGAAAPAGGSPLLAGKEQIERVVQLARETGTDLERLRADLLRKFGIREFADLRAEQAADLAGWLERRPKKTVAAVAPAPAPKQAEANGHAAADAVPPPPPVPAPATKLDEAQFRDVKALFEALHEFGLTREQAQAILAKRGVRRIADLAAADAADLILKLRARLHTEQMRAKIEEDDANPPEERGEEEKEQQEGAAASAAAEKSTGTGAA